MIFVDTAAFCALLDARDPNHPRARETFESLAANDEPLLSHEYVVVETMALVQRRLGLGPLRSLVDGLLPLIVIDWVDQALHAEAREALLASGRRGISLVDWTSFLVMRRHGVEQVFTFDPDFLAQGFSVVPAT